MRHTGTTDAAAAAAPQLGNRRPAKNAQREPLIEERRVRGELQESEREREKGTKLLTTTPDVDDDGSRAYLALLSLSSRLRCCSRAPLDLIQSARLERRV